MQETVKENKDRKINKIMEVFNEKLTEEGLEENKINVESE